MPNQIIRRNKIFSYFSKTSALIRSCWLIVGITLFYLVVIDAVLGLALKHDVLQKSDGSEAWIDEYQYQDWGHAYEKEFKAANKSQWRSYVYWRRQPFAGAMINVDAEGNRKTWNRTTTNAVKVFVFGGSTIWGTAARDDQTIPSLLSKQLKEQYGKDVLVTNFGESGYVSTQEVILLEQLLRQGKIPDVVIFYDGANDTFSALQNKIAGIPQNEDKRRQDFLPLGQKFQHLTIERIKGTATGRFITQVADKLQSPQLLLPMKPEDRDRLANQVIDVYLANLQIIGALAKSYNFKYAFYWQPVIFSKSRPTEFEERIRFDKDDYRHFFEDTYKKLEERTTETPSALVNMSRAFNDTASGLFIDFCHVTEAGNAKIATAIAKDVSKLF